MPLAQCSCQKGGVIYTQYPFKHRNFIRPTLVLQHLPADLFALMTNITTAVNLPFHVALLGMAPFFISWKWLFNRFLWFWNSIREVCVCWERTGDRQPPWLRGRWWIVSMTWVIICIFFTSIWEVPQQSSHLVRALPSHRALRDALSRAETMVTFYLCHISGLCAVFPTAGEGGETLLAEVRSHTGPCSEYLLTGQEWGKAVQDMQIKYHPQRLQRLSSQAWQHV